MASNWHIANYLWQYESSKEIAESLTGGRVNNLLDFMKECLRENGDYAYIGHYKAPRYEPELSHLAHIAEGE